MAVVRKLKNTYEDGRGNLVGTNNPSTPVRSAAQVHDDMLDNVTRSMMPTGNAQVGVAPGTENIYKPTNVPNQGPTTTPGVTANINLTRTMPAMRLGADYAPSDRVSMYQQRLGAAEAGPKPTWQSRYEPQIESILDNILNRRSFDLNNDPNYQKLYDQYSQRYMLQGNRAMRDQLGAAASLTGGYGSTAAQAAASQAYDQYMQGLNDRNMQLMQLAYQMYGDEIRDNYNQLGAVTGLDQTDYGRYRDDVSDYYRDRDYLADRYDTELGFDYGQFQDDRSYNDKAYDDAISAAIRFANSGLTIPERYAARLDEGTLAQLQALAQQTAAVTAGGRSGRSGGNGGRSKSGAETEGETSERSFIVNDEDQESYELATIDRMIDAGYSDAEIAKELRKIEKEADKVRSGYVGSVKPR